MGRKKIFADRKQCSVYLSKDERECIERLSCGNVSQFIRQAVIDKMSFGMTVDKAVRVSASQEASIKDSYAADNEPVVDTKRAPKPSQCVPMGLDEAIAAGSAVARLRS